MKPLKCVRPLYLRDLILSILLDEIFDVNEATPYSDEHLIAFFNLDIDTFLSKAVGAFRFSDEKNVHFLPVWIQIEKICQCLVDWVKLFANVDSFIVLKILNELTEFGNLILRLLELLQKFQANGFRLIELLLDLVNL